MKGLFSLRLLPPMLLNDAWRMRIAMKDHILAGYLKPECYY